MTSLPRLSRKARRAVGDSLGLVIHLLPILAVTAGLAIIPRANAEEGAPPKGPTVSEQGSKTASKKRAPVSNQGETSASKSERAATNLSTKPSKASPAKTPVARSQFPGVMSKAEADRKKQKSRFLQPPGAGGTEVSGRYASEEDDWSDLPVWRQTSFFNIRARGQFFIYVIDGSGSMIDEDRFPRATIELRRSVFALQPPQRFEVIFYNDLSIPMPGGPTPRPADLKSKSDLLHWLRLMEPEGETNPLPALTQAISLRPDAIFFLSDGVLPDGTVEAVTKRNRGKIPIHCIDLAGGLGGDQLRRIARENGGNYASRAGNLQGPR